MSYNKPDSNKKHAIVFAPGTHGNFLARIISIACGYTPDQDLYKNTIGAHTKMPIMFHKYHNPPAGDYWLKITYRPEDLYILMWNTDRAAGDFACDLLTDDWRSHEGWNVQKIQSYSKFEPYEGDQAIKEMWKHQLSNFIPFETDNCTFRHELAFHAFYNEYEFKYAFKYLMKDLKLDYLVDIMHHYEAFIKDKQPILDSKQKVEKAVNNNDLCLYEQAYYEVLNDL